jgi:hypothetical protein
MAAGLTYNNLMIYLTLTFIIKSPNYQIIKWDYVFFSE